MCTNRVRLPIIGPLQPRLLQRENQASVRLHSRNCRRLLRTLTPYLQFTNNHPLVLFFLLRYDHSLINLSTDYKRGLVQEDTRRVGFRVLGKHKGESMEISDEYVWKWKHTQR